MITAHILESGIVINSILLADDADPASFGAILGPKDTGIGWTYDGADWNPPREPALSLDDLRAAKIAAISAKAEALLAAGAPADGGLHVALDDGGRADLTAMAATATAAASGAVAWPESYSRGWITIENVRISFATPVAGLMLAASAGNYYAGIVQHRRDLKDEALASSDAAALDAIDITAGWPG